MYSLFRKVHMYAGLLNLSILLIFGISGLWATFEPAPDRVYEFVKLPMSVSLPNPTVRRDGDNNLALDFYGVNGVRRAIVLEKENRIRIETRRTPLASFINGLHTTTINSRMTDWRIRYWTYYNEFSIWSLIGMSISGVYLWLASRPRYRPARFVFTLGCGSFILLYAVTR
jgi:hypothetical protein